MLLCIFSMSSSSFYNTIAHHYDTYCKHSGINECLEEELSLLEHYSPSSILEFGIGTGRFAQAYLQKHPHTSYTGVDNSQEMLQKIQDPRIICIHADFETYSKELLRNKKYYDVIVAPYTALHHIETKRQQELLRTLQQLTPVIIFNCLNEQEEKKIFEGNLTSTSVTFSLPKEKEVSTIIHSIHPEIRTQAKCIPSQGERVYLLFETV